MPKTCPFCQSPVSPSGTSANVTTFAPPILPSGLWGWQRIADFMGIGKSTAKRYWRDRGMPVIPFGDPRGRPRMWSHPALLFAWLLGYARTYRTFRRKQQGNATISWH